MEVVAMLREAAVSISDRARVLLWALAVLDVMTVAWMLSAGDWLDRASPVTSVVTLGGNHLVVLWLAVAGFLLLAAVALPTGGLAVVRRGYVPLLVLSALLSVVALAGVLAGLLFVVLAVFLVALLGAALMGRAVVFLGSIGNLFRR
jgi:hypothetical protein